MGETREELISGLMKIHEIEVELEKIGNPIQVMMPNLARILALTVRNQKLVFSIAFDGPHESTAREFFLYESGDELNLEGAQFFIGTVQLKQGLVYCFERC